MDVNKKKRPVYLNLVKIRLPLPGFVSILHRISGAMLFLLLPFLLTLWQASLATPESFNHFTQNLSNPCVKIILFGLIWAYLHHFCAGSRFLLLDVNKGIELHQARRSSVIVLVVSIALTLILGVRLW